MARMTAGEILRRYAAGERNFCNANLRGANFRGQDLSGADFSGTDICSANFADAKLCSVNFTRAQAGLQRRWIVVQLLLTAVIAAVAGVLQGFAGAFSTLFFNSSSFHSATESVISGGVYVLLIFVVYAAISFQGFTIRAFGSILSAFAFAVAVPVAVAGAGAVAFAVAGAFAFAFAFAFAVAVAVAFAVAGTGAVVVAGSVAVAVAFAVAVTFVFAGAFAVVGAVAVAFAVAVTVAVAVAGLLFSFYVGWRVLKEDEKFDILRGFGLVLAALGGTSFAGADLTGATFSQAKLKSTNFADSRQGKTTFTHVCWKQAEQLNRARLGRAILQDRRIRTLLSAPEKGYKQDLTDANLRGANLSGVTLEKAILRRAILSDALLRDTVLKNAILTEVQAVNVDFTGACLTGATIEGWNIDSTTTLKNIDCQYIFERETPDEKGSRERRPHDPDKVFQPGDFETFYKEMPDGVKILIRNGIDTNAFRAAMKYLMEQNPDINPDSIKSYEKQGEDVLVTFQVPEGTDKAEIERNWDTGYRAGLKVGKERERLESGPKFEKLAFLLAERDVNFENRTEVMTGNDYSSRISIQGDVNQSAVVAGDRNQVSNQISQLGETTNQVQLKNLLTQLQSAIESEPNMSEEAKTDALAEVGEIAAAGQAPQDGAMKKAAKRSLNVLKGITLGLGETTKLAQTAKGLLSAIALLFGL